MGRTSRDVPQRKAGRWGPGRPTAAGAGILTLLAALALTCAAAAAWPDPAGARAGVGAPGPVGVRPVGGAVPAAGAAADAAAAAPEVARPPAPGTAYVWPLGSPLPHVVRPFREPTHRFGPGHRGVDLAAAPAATVHAAAAGVVVFAGRIAGRGVVSVQHPDGLRTTYEPVTPAVPAGLTVARGDAVGTLDPGHAGCPAACLHWGVRRDRGVYVDPVLLVASPSVRLLPVPDPWPDGPAPDPVSAAAAALRRGAPTPPSPRCSARCVRGPPAQPALWG